MKRNFIFLTKIMMFCMICANIAGIFVNIQVREAFEKRVLYNYENENYLGPETSRLPFLTSREIEEWNPEDSFYFYETDPAKNYKCYDIRVNGRFSDQKISDIYDARKSVYSLAEYLGIKYDRNSFLYGEKQEDKEPESDDTYRFYQYYNGVCV